MANNIKHQLFSGVFYTALAKYSGIIISLVVAGILARLLSPDDFGVVAIATVIIAFFNLFTDMGISPAIVQHKSLTKEELSDIFSFTVWTGIGISILFFAASWLIADYYESGILRTLCQLLSVNLFFASANIVPGALFYRNKEFKFIVKTKLLKNGEAPVLMRITINGSYDDARIQRSVPLNLWNAAKGCSKGRDRASIALNTYIAELHARALEKHKELVLEQALITPKLILKRVFGKDTEMRTLLGTMQDGIKEMETLTGIDYSPVTINRYKNVVKKLQRLIPSYYGKEDITFHELTPEFIRAFDIYLKTEGGLCRNTIVRYMKCFKKFTNMALAKEWMRKNPFYGYKMEQDETDPVFLTYDELQAVMKKKFTIPRLELVRDIFVFACFTGLAFSDVATLSGENLVQDNLGDWWIRKGRVKLEHRRKASSISNIPLLPVPLAILEKYREHPICVKKGCCLPVMCNQKMNSYLKEIADFCGIKKNLTTHVARHTFGTTVTLANNVPLQDVSVMLGHASTRMTQHYARVMNSSLKEAMNNVKERLEW